MTPAPPETYTKDAAYGQFEEGAKGTIEVGKLADLVVLSSDIMKVPEDEILGTRVDLTIVDGRVRFEREAARASAGSGPSPGP